MTTNQPTKEICGVFVNVSDPTVKAGHWCSNLKPCKDHPAQAEEWEKTFDELVWPMNLAGTGVDMEMVERDEQVKSFIRSLLASHTKKVREEGKHEELKEHLAIIEQKLKAETSYPGLLTG